MCEWSNIGPMGCLIHPQLIPIGCQLKREPAPVCRKAAASVNWLAVGRKNVISKIPRGKIVKFSPTFNPCACPLMTEYRAKICHTGRLIMKHRLNCLGNRKTVRINKGALHSCTFEKPCYKFIRL